MSERISNKKQNFDGIDPQESLIKSLESIKSLLKQGDSKISEARENIARADTISSDNIETRLNDSKQKVSKPAINSSRAIKKPTNLPSSADQHQTAELEVEAVTEEIIVQKVSENSTFSTNNSISPKSSPAKNTGLNDLYDHDLIVPMLDEIVMPDDEEEEETALFNMDSSFDIKIEPTPPLLDLNNFEKVSGGEKLAPIANQLKIEKNSSDKPENTTKADIISFELSSNAKKNNLKKTENPTSEVDKSITLVTESNTNLEQVVIKETTDNNDMIDISIPLTVETVKTDESVAPRSEQLKSKNSTTSDLVSEIMTEDLTPELTQAIESSVYTDDILTSISSTELKQADVVSDSSAHDKVSAAISEKVTDTTNQQQIPKVDDVVNVVTESSTELLPDEIDFTSIEGLNTLKFNADKMSSLQKRIEKRVHNRLIQLIVQLDDEIKNIFTDEIKNCVAHEAKNNKT